MRPRKFVLALIALLSFAIQCQAQQPVRQAMKRVQVGVQRICFGDHCEMVPQYAYVIDESLAPPPLPVPDPVADSPCPCGPECTCDPCDCPLPTANAVEHERTFATPLRSFVRSRPLQRVFAARPIRSFFCRLFGR